MNQLRFLRSLVLAAAAPAAFVACGGSTESDGAGNTSAGGSGGSGTAGSGTSGSATAGSGTAGSGTAGSGTAGSGTGGTGTAGSGTAGTAGSGTAGTGTAGTSTAGGGPTAFPCASPMPLLVDGKDTGVESCADGSLHKKTAGECPKGPPKSTPCMAAGGTCLLDSECTAMPNGYCGNQSNFGGVACACIYGCTKDADCGAGNVCLCGDPVGKCVKGGCTKDADCGAGAICSTYDETMGCGILATACRKLGDMCGGDKDCAPNEYCIPDPMTGYRHCTPGGCAIGRPMFVEAALVVATATATSAWA